MLLALTRACLADETTKRTGLVGGNNVKQRVRVIVKEGVSELIEITDFVVVHPTGISPGFDEGARLELPGQWDSTMPLHTACLQSAAIILTFAPWEASWCAT